MRDLGEVIGLIAIATGAVILGLSYCAAYLIGRAHGRRDEARFDRTESQLDSEQRLMALEATMRGVNASVERIMDAQRLLVAQQDHLSRKVGLSSERMSIQHVPGHRTPS